MTGSCQSALRPGILFFFFFFAYVSASWLGTIISREGCFVCSHYVVLVPSHSICKSQDLHSVKVGVMYLTVASNDFKTRSATVRSERG